MLEEVCGVNVLEGYMQRLELLEGGRVLGTLLEDGDNMGYAYSHELFFVYSSV